jgi:hypothetical protein
MMTDGQINKVIAEALGHETRMVSGTCFRSIPTALNEDGTVKSVTWIPANYTHVTEVAFNAVAGLEITEMETKSKPNSHHVVLFHGESLESKKAIGKAETLPMAICQAIVELLKLLKDENHV